MSDTPVAFTASLSDLDQGLKRIPEKLRTPPLHKAMIFRLGIRPFAKQANHTVLVRDQQGVDSSLARTLANTVKQTIHPFSPDLAYIGPKRRQGQFGFWTAAALLHGRKKDAGITAQYTLRYPVARLELDLVCWKRMRDCNQIPIFCNLPSRPIRVYGFVLPPGRQFAQYGKAFLR